MALLHRSLVTLALLILSAVAIAATRTATIAYSVGGNPNLAMITWTGLLNGDVGNGIELAEYADRTFQVTGTFGTGGSVTLQGSNDGTIYASLTDGAGDAITCTATCMRIVLENPRYIRPSVTAGDGTTSLVVTVFGKRIR